MKINVKEVGVADDGICALDTNGNKLPVGEYEVELVTRAKLSVGDGWITILTDSDRRYFEHQSAVIEKVYISIVAPEKEGVNVGEIWVDTIHNEVEIVSKHDNVSGRYNCKKLKNGSSCLRDLSDLSYKKTDLIKHIDTTALSVNKQPEKEVDTIEQEFEAHIELSNSILHAAHNWKTDSTWSNHLAEINKVCRELTHIKATHVPIEDYLQMKQAAQKLAGLILNIRHETDYMPDSYYKWMDDVLNETDELTADDEPIN